MSTALRVIIVTLCCAAMPVGLATPGMPIYVGVLESPQTDESQPNPPVSSHTHVRIAFQSDGPDWRPMDTEFGTPAALAEVSQHYPPRVAWTVVFNGKAVGRISSRDPGLLHWYADIGTQIITTRTQDVPEIHTGASSFLYTIKTAKARPLLLVSAPNFRDPQDWKPTTLRPSELHLAIAAFRGKVPNSERCDEPEQQPIHKVPYRDESVSVLKAYRSNDGEVVLGLQLNDAQANCGFFDDETFFDYWFVIDKQTRVLYLDRQMTPMEAADLNNSGRSAFMFFTSRGEDEEGYELFYDDFSKQAYFHWFYH